MSAPPGPPEARSGPPPVRRRLLAFTLASLAVGAAVMLAFDTPAARVVGVSALFAFIVSGVFLIADPDHLARDEDGE